MMNKLTNPADGIPMRRRMAGSGNTWDSFETIKVPTVAKVGVKTIVPGESITVTDDEMKSPQIAVMLKKKHLVRTAAA